MGEPQHIGVFVNAFLKELALPPVKSSATYDAKPLLKSYQQLYLALFPEDSVAWKKDIREN